MARQRTIKPEINDDEDMIHLSIPARYFYACLWCHLDGQQLIELSLRSIRSKVFPRETETISLELIQSWIDELTRPGPSGRPRLVKFDWKGKTLLHCPTLKKHGRVFSDEKKPFDVPPGHLETVVKAAFGQNSFDFQPPLTPAVQGQNDSEISDEVPRGSTSEFPRRSTRNLPPSSSSSSASPSTPSSSSALAREEQKDTDVSGWEGKPETVRSWIADLFGPRKPAKPNPSTADLEARRIELRNQAKLLGGPT